MRCWGLISFHLLFYFFVSIDLQCHLVQQQTFSISVFVFSRSLFSMLFFVPEDSRRHRLMSSRVNPLVLLFLHCVLPKAIVDTTFFLTRLMIGRLRSAYVSNAPSRSFFPEIKRLKTPLFFTFTIHGHGQKVLVFLVIRFLIFSIFLLFIF